MPPPFPNILGKPRGEQAAGTGRGPGMPPGANGGGRQSQCPEKVRREATGADGGGGLCSLCSGFPPRSVSSRPILPTEMQEEG